MAGPRPWLSVVGIGDDGLDGLSPAARATVADAELLVGGARHQAMVADSAAERLTWIGGPDATMDAIERRRGGRVVVLASGDPMWFGAGATLARRFAPAEMQILPAPGAFSLAAAAMGWALAEVETLSVHGRPLESLKLFLCPGARLLVLSRDGDSAAEVAALLCACGFGPSELTVLEHLGGPRARRHDGTAQSWDRPRGADLNTLAIVCRPGPEARLYSTAPGLPDEAFAHDGQLTKREVRALTLAALAPLPGQVLWDVGAGAGSVAIEWLRATPRTRPAGGRAARAIAVESDARRCAVMGGNAAALGVPKLEIVHGEAPAALAGLDSPNSVFVGGGLTRPGLLESCWRALAAGGRLVANAVSIEGAARLADFRSENGGDLIRLAVARADALGRFTGFRPLLEVVQYIGIKPGIQP
ncbi:MAG: precorrin-6y C5,15-methyltransferase (decarboxylating) subunit CbiE [Rhodospirillales bacterium]|nr:precorrin-6y C5,15-methyltransferase (decarboxylating) subunit CbiE [Rhodospirillales bacterium]